MNATIETYNNKIKIILPLVDDVYGRASAIAETVYNTDIDAALAYYLPKISTITLDIFDARTDVETAIDSKVTTRRNGWTRQAF